MPYSELGSSANSVQASASSESVENVKRAITEHFPNLWPAVEAGLSTCATLLLADSVNPVALVLVGPSSAGKTTVAAMFDGATAQGEPICYRSDKFTPAAFVSQSAQATEEKLKKVDLLPQLVGGPA